MSKQRKHVEVTILTQYAEPNEKERIVRVKESRGRNTLEVTYPNGDNILVLIPAKFQKKIWFKKDNFVIIEPTFLYDSSSKVLAVITQALYAEDIQHLVTRDIWPPEFLAEVVKALAIKDVIEVANPTSYLDMDFMDDSSEEENQEFQFLGHNPNHKEEFDDGSSEESA